MAVMTTQHSEGVAFEQKTIPVPSSDTMALDLEINGTSNHDETTFDSAPPPSDITLNKIIEISSSDNVAAHSVEVNGDANIDAYSANQSLVAPPVDVSVESRHTEESPGFIDNQSSSHPVESMTTDTEILQPSNSADLGLPASPTSIPLASATESVIETAIDSAVDDNAATSSILPVIEPLESDIRDTALPLAPMADAVAGVPIDQPFSGVDYSEGSEPQTKVEPMDSSTSAADASLTFETSTKISPSPINDREQLPQLSPADQEPSTMIPVEQEQPTSTIQESQDIEMADAPAPPTKVSREREDDTEAEPSAKRTKTDDEDKVPVAAEAQPVAANGEIEGAKPEDIPITPFVGKEIIKILKNCLRTNNGKNFRAPVRVLWPNFADAYEAKVPNPIDLVIIEAKVKGGKYATMDAFRADIELIYSNALLFNGTDNPITVAGKDVRDTILAKVATLPAEPVAAPKAPKNKPRKSTPVAEAPARVTPARRPSRSAGTSAAAPPAQTFALDPATSTPLIRRDSTKEQGGRPKREIHPPKNKDLIYSVRPKNKKYATELKFCEEVLNEVKKQRYMSFMSVFLTPVDPVALNIPHYFTVIKNPMDVSTVGRKLSTGDYSRAKDFEHDMRLIITNCYKFNPEGNPVHEMGRQFENLFNSQWAKKDAYIQDHTPAALSPSSSAGEEEEDSEEEEEVEVQPVNSAATLRLIEEQNKLITLMASKKTDPAIVTMQQDMVDFLKQKVEEENARAPAIKKTSKKAKPAKAVKKTVPAKKIGGAGANKKGGSKKEKERYLGTLEKEIISAGLGELPEHVAGSVLDMIKKDQPNVDESAGEIEVDIEVISHHILWYIYDLVMKHAPDVATNLKKAMAERDKPQALAKPAPKKKNKPMSKFEQERKIEQLQKSVQQFERQGSGSQEPVLPTVEQPESSGDEESDSEEE